MVNYIGARVKTAQAAAQAAISAFRGGTCTIYEATDSASEYEDTVTWAKVAEDIPCHLTYESAPDTSDTATADGLVQTIRLYVNPSVEIKAGSRIDVTQNGVTVSYRDSGKPRVYATHREIDLQLLEEYA